MVLNWYEFMKTEGRVPHTPFHRSQSRRFQYIVYIQLTLFHTQEMALADFFPLEYTLDRQRST